MIFYMPENPSKITKNWRGREPLLIRADADSRMGTGHVMRCIALGQAWKEMAEGGSLKPENSGFKSHPSSLSSHPSVIFICATIPDPLAERVQSEGFGLIRISAEPGSAEDIRQTLENSIRLSSDLCPLSSDLWIVIDGYQFGLEYQRAVRKAGCKLLLIDDYNHQSEYECDILLNQNINAAELNYKINPDARLLLGTDYAMLRHEFFQGVKETFPNIGKTQQAPTQSVPSIGNNILVTLGGADPDNVTLKVIKALQQIDLPQMYIKVIVGPANPHLEALKNSASHSTFDFRLLTDVRDMSGLMHWSDLAVSAAGSTCWELCCLGVPFVTLVLAENQVGLAEGLSERGVAICLGENPSVSQIAATVQTLAKSAGYRADCSARGRALVDGFGVLRILRRPAQDAGMDLFAGRLKLRCADARDMEQLWVWANDPSVRRNSYHPEPIPLAEHKKWFEKKFNAPESLILILELDGTAAGQVRYDRIDAETAEIDFSIDARFRGLGLGIKILEMSFNEIFNRLPINTVRAEVFQSNPASQAALKKTGFKLEDACAIKGVPILIYLKTK